MFFFVSLLTSSSCRCRDCPSSIAEKTKTEIVNRWAIETCLQPMQVSPNLMTQTEFLHDPGKKKYSLTFIGFPRFCTKFLLIFLDYIFLKHTYININIMLHLVPTRTKPIHPEGILTVASAVDSLSGNKTFEFISF